MYNCIYIIVLFTDPKAQDLLEWSRTTWSPDEHYWATLYYTFANPHLNTPHGYKGTLCNLVILCVKLCVYICLCIYVYIQRILRESCATGSSRADEFHNCCLFHLLLSISLPFFLLNIFVFVG